MPPPISGHLPSQLRSGPISHKYLMRAREKEAVETIHLQVGSGVKSPLSTQPPMCNLLTNISSQHGPANDALGDPETHEWHLSIEQRADLNAETLSSQRAFPGHGGAHPATLSTQRHTQKERVHFLGGADSRPNHLAQTTAGSMK